MKWATSFILGVTVGVFAVLAIERARQLVGDEDVEVLKDRVSESLKNLESTVSELAEGLTETFADALDSATS